MATEALSFVFTPGLRASNHGLLSEHLDANDMDKGKHQATTSLRILCSLHSSPAQVRA